MMEGKERGDKKKEELIVKKLKHGIMVGKRGGPSTPSPTWRFHFTSPTQNQTNTISSARKLCANLWEIQRQHHHSFTKISNHAGRPHIPKYEVTENNVLRNNKEQDRIKSAIQSMRREVVEEKKLRKHSESLHRKLARELLKIKSSISNTLKELEREKKARILLENLCDEFFRSIRDYEYELCSLKNNGGIHCVDSPDQLILLHISEAWLDERMQRKLAEAQNNVAEDNTIVVRLIVDIETFLQAKCSVKSRTIDNSSANEVIKCSSRHESFPFNQEASAPQHAVDEDNSTDSDLHHLERLMETSRKQRKSHSSQCGNDAPECHSKVVVKSKSKRKMVKGFLPTQSEESLLRINDQFLEVQHFIKNHSLSSEGDKIHPEGKLNGDPCPQSVFAGCTSPVKQGKSKLTLPEIDKSESSSMLPRDMKENTLEAKLLEARIESQKSRSKAS